MFRLAILFFLSGTSAIFGIEIYETTQGPVFSDDPDSNGVRTFRSIPFAAPPLSDLRWRPPQPVPSWTDPRNVSGFPAICKQQTTYPLVPADHSIDSEDCLYLYLYTTSPPVTNSSVELDLKPVLVFVHGGGLNYGDGWLDGYYNGSPLVLSQDVVVVSVQYRLGALGFLAHEAFSYGEDVESRGNFGALDQRAALQWVQDNVASFGGDPSQVLLFGESAGGLSMCFHLVSPGSASLFQSLVMESGSCALASQSKGGGEVVASSFASLVGCSNDDDAELEASCLRSLPADNLTYPVGTEVGALDGNEFWSAPAFPWGFTVDGTDVGLPDFPMNLLGEGRFNRARTVLGTNTDEFQCACSRVNYNGSACLFADWLPNIVPDLGAASAGAGAGGVGAASAAGDGGASGSGVVTTEDEMRLVVEHALGFGLSDQQWSEALSLYPPDTYGGSAIDRLSRMLVESAWIGHCDTERVAALISSSALDGDDSSDLWVYHFALPVAANGLVMHFSEVAYVFGLCEGSPVYCASPSNTSVAVSNSLMSFWANLARGQVGEPAPEAVWPRYSVLDDDDHPATTLRIDAELTTEQNYRSGYCSFWQGLQQNSTPVLKS